MKISLKGKLLIAVALLSPIISLLFYFWGNFYDLLNPYSISMFFGITSYVYFINVLIISARIKVLDRIFGHDRVMIFHGNLAIVAIILAFIHRYFKLKVFSTENLQLNLGSYSLIIFFFVMVTTLLFMAQNILMKLNWMSKLRDFVHTKLGVDYSIFKLFHNFLMVAIIFLSIHVYLASSTQENWWRIIVMGGWTLIGFGLWIWHKLLKPLISKSKNIRIFDVKRLSSNLVEINFSGEAVSKYKAGQYIYIRFPKLKFGWDEHPFTLSSAPFESYCSITVKALGNLTSKLSNLSKGDKVVVDGPYGKFTLDKSDNPVVFIAGGIGITPFYSIIKENAKALYRPIILFWGVQHEEDLVYHSDLKSVEKESEYFKYIPVVSRKKISEEIETGHIDKYIIKKYISKNPEAYLWYFCGPTSMRNFVFRNISEIGVKTKNILYEKFSF